MLIPLAGFLAGLHHVVAGPDHLAAVAPLAVSDRRTAWRAGLTWAVGHAGGVGLIALIALAVREATPVHTEFISGWSERLVGIVLVGIGLWGFRRALSRRLHSHVHDHAGSRHVHVHLHAPPGAHDSEVETVHTHSHAAMAVGTLHGLAGGAHFLGVLPALALGTSDAIVYLASYGVGTIAAMLLFAWIMGHLAAQAVSLGTGWARGMMMLSSGAAVAVGVFWIFSGSGTVV